MRVARSSWPQSQESSLLAFGPRPSSLFAHPVPGGIFLGVFWLSRCSLEQLLIVLGSTESSTLGVLVHLALLAPIVSSLHRSEFEPTGC